MNRNPRICGMEDARKGRNPRPYYLKDGEEVCVDNMTNHEVQQYYDGYEYEEIQYAGGFRRVSKY